MADNEVKNDAENIKKKIMIIDDEQDFLEITKLNLEGTGKYEVMPLSNTKDIIPKLRSFDPDVILLDILMPGKDGLQICEMLNSDPIGKEKPIIIISALIKNEDKLRAYKLGVIDYLTKPVEKNSLIFSIDKAMRFK